MIRFEIDRVYDCIVTVILSTKLQQIDVIDGLSFIDQWTEFPMRIFDLWCKYDNNTKDQIQYIG